MLGIIVSLIVFSILIWRLPIFRIEGIPKSYILSLWFVKVLAGFALYYLYTYYYTDPSKADIHKYFNDGNILHSAVKGNLIDYFRMLLGIGDNTKLIDENYYQVMNHWYREWKSTIPNDNRTIIRLNAFFRLYSGGNFHVHSISMNVLSTIGLVYALKSIIRHINLSNTTKRAGILLIFLIPSVMFWTSSVLKEGLLIFGVGLFLFHSLNFRKNTVSSWLGLFLSIVILLSVKFYILFLFLPLIFAFQISKQLKFSQTKTIITYTLSLLSFWIITYFPSLLLGKKLSPLFILYKKQDDFIRLAAVEQSGSRIDVSPLEPTISSFLRNMPEAFINATFRPFPWELNSVIQILPVLETVFLVLLTSFVIYYRKKNLNLNLNLIMFFLMFITSLNLIIGWTTPVLGAIVRYRVPGILILILLLLSLVDGDRVSDLFKNWNKRI